MDRVDRHDPAGSERPECRDDHAARGRERDSRVEGDRRRVVVTTGPGCAEADGALALGRAPARHVDLATPVPGDLDGKQRRRAEAVQAQAAAGLHAGDPEGAIADHPAAQERRGGQVRRTLRQAQGEVRPDGHPLGVATVAVPAGEAGLGAEVLASGPTGRAVAAGAREPSHAGSLADRPAGHRPADGLHPSHGLVARHDRQRMRREVALHDLEVRPADATSGHAEQQLVVGRLRDRPFLQAEMVEAGRAGFDQGEGSHVTMLPPVRPPGGPQFRPAGRLGYDWTVTPAGRAPSGGAVRQQRPGEVHRVPRWANRRLPSREVPRRRRLAWRGDHSPAGRGRPCSGSCRRPHLSREVAR